MRSEGEKTPGVDAVSAKKLALVSLPPMRELFPPSEQAVVLEEYRTALRDTIVGTLGGSEGAEVVAEVLSYFPHAGNLFVRLQERLMPRYRWLRDHSPQYGEKYGRAFSALDTVVRRFAPDMHEEPEPWDEIEGKYPFLYSPVMTPGYLSGMVRGRVQKGFPFPPTRLTEEESYLLKGVEHKIVEVDEIILGLRAWREGKITKGQLEKTHITTILHRHERDMLSYTKGELNPLDEMLEIYAQESKKNGPVWGLRNLFPAFRMVLDIRGWSGEDTRYLEEFLLPEGGKKASPKEAEIQ